MDRVEKFDIDLDDLRFPCNIVTQLNQWNDQYKSIMSLSEEERAKRMDVINALDKEGLELSEKLRVLLDARVRYFSEGLLKYIE